MNVDGTEWNADVKCLDVGTVGNEVVSIIPMIYNHRVVIGPADDRFGYAHGWCYSDALSALAAVAIWDPATEPEPAGYIKRATPGMRVTA